MISFITKIQIQKKGLKKKEDSNTDVTVCLRQSVTKKKKAAERSQIEEQSESGAFEC